MIHFPFLHKWRLVGAHPQPRGITMPGQDLLLPNNRAEWSVLLFHCRCGAVKTKNVWGSYPPESPEVAELQRLFRLPTK